MYYGVPPFDHTTCSLSFDYKKEGACPAAGNGSSVEMYNTMASSAHAILNRCVNNGVDREQQAQHLGLLSW